MIILAGLLYSLLASGGYLDSFGSFGNFSTGLLNFDFLNSDETTPNPVPTPLIPLKPKNLGRVHNKMNANRIPLMRHFNNGYLQTQNHKRKGRFMSKSPPQASKPQLASRGSIARIPVKTRTTSTTAKTPLTTETLTSTSDMTSTDGSLFMNIVTETGHKRKPTTDIPLQTNYVTKYIEKCPDEGYFFKRDLQEPNSDTCYLCFCKGNGTSICWKRNNKKCDADSYQHNWPKKRVSRNRRNVFDFKDFFMKDAAKTVFNAQSQKTCKPNEASYSEGCPPLDWCVGCTVCDCNTNGKWECHLLSFCTDDNKKNKNKNKYDKGELQGHFYDPFEKPKIQRAERERAQREIQDLAEKMAQARQKKKIGKSNRRRYFFKNGTLVNKTMFDLRKRKKSPTILNQSSAEIQKWSNLNMKIRKIPDQATRQKMIDLQHQNARKVSESANFFVRKMPNIKTKRLIEQKHAQAVNILAKRQPARKKKRQVILPSGIKLPKELLDKLPPGLILPTRNPPGDNFSSKSHVKRVLLNQMAATKPPRQMLVKRSLELPSEITDKKLVKRSTKLNMSKKQTTRKENKAQFHKAAKSLSKKPSLFKKQTTGIKANAKKRSLTITNSKTLMKTNSKSNHGGHKNNQLENNGFKTSKNKKINKVTKKSVHSKNKNSVKNSPNDLRKSLKNNNNNRNKVQQRGNQRKTMPTKNKNKNKDTKNHLRNITGLNMKKGIKDKKANNYSSKKNKHVTINEDKISKKPIKKKINKPTKTVLNKTNFAANHLRDKRSNSAPWVKIVTESEKVTKYAPIDLGKNKIQSSTKNPKMKINKQNNAEITRRNLNEEMKKLTGNMQANLNRKVLEAVEKMLNFNLTHQGKKVKRSSDLHMKFVDQNESMVDSINFLTFNPDSANKFNEGQMLDVTNVTKEKHGLSFLGYSGQKSKRSPKDDEGYNESLHIPFIIKKRPLPPVKHIEKREILINQLQDQFTSRPSLIDQPWKAFKAMDTYLKSTKMTTAGYLTTDIYRNVPFSKPGKKDVDLIDIYVPIKKSERNVKGLLKRITQNNKIKYRHVSSPVLGVPVTQLQHIKVNNFNVVKVKKSKRSADIEKPKLTSLFENESSTNSIQDLYNDTSSTNNRKTTSSLSKYYKYTVDNYLDFNTEQDLKNNETEIVEVNTKNIAAKRSVDKQVGRSTNSDIAQIKDSANKTRHLLINNNKIENRTVLDNDDKLKVYDAVTVAFSPTDVLDDKVVIIQDQNVSFIDSLAEPTTHLLPSPTKITDSDRNIVNGNYLVAKSYENTDESNLFLDNSVVNIRDQNRELLPTTTGFNLISTTELKIVSKLDDIANKLDTKELFLIMTAENNNEKINSKKENIELLAKPTSSTRSKIADELTLFTVSENDSTENKTLFPENVDTKLTNDYLVVRENEFKPKKMNEMLHDSSNQYLPKLTTPTSEKIILSSFKPNLKNSLKYDIYNQGHGIKQKLAERSKKNEVEKIKQGNSDINLTEQPDFRHGIDDKVIIVKQKEPYKNTEKSPSDANNEFVLTTDQNVINYNVLPYLKPKTVKQDIKAITNSTLRFSKTSYEFNSTKDIPLFQEKKLSTTNFEVIKVKTYDIRKLSKKAKKHKLKKVLTTLYNKTNKLERYLIKETEKDKNNHTSTKTHDLKNLFKKLLSNFKFNKHMRKPTNIKRLKIITYLQKFMKKIFSDVGKNKTSKTLAHQLNRKNVIETLCASFGPCNKNVKNKAKLQSLIDHLNSETYKMLRSIKIIKGLLKLVDMAKNDKKVNNVTLKSNFKSDVQKLHAILRGTYSNSGETDTLTDTQRIQIQYIKNSTQNFIQSAAKFTMVLNKIINIISLHENKIIEKNIHNPTFKGKEKPTVKEVFKTSNNTKTVTVTESNGSLQKLKKLISKYSLIQNTIMRKIYNILANLDRKQNVYKKNRAIDAIIGTKSKQRLNKTEEIQMYTKNIIQNLRKLKDLAQSSNGDMAHVRRKRDLKDEDNLEYILMLMEYLLKQKQPLDNAPVTDGIDLLLDVIKSAPEIKSNKEKVLPVHRYYFTKRPKTIFTARKTLKSSKSVETKQPTEVSSESDNKPSKEENVTSSYLPESKLNIIDQTLDDEAEEHDYYVYTRKSDSSSATPMTSTDTTSTDRNNEYVTTGVTTDVFYNTITDAVSENKDNHAYKFAKLDIFDSYVDEPVPSTSNVYDYTIRLSTTETPTKTVMITLPTESSPGIQLNRRYSNEDVSSSKSRLDWIDETYEEEIRESQSTSPAPIKSTKHAKIETKAPEILSVTKKSKKSDDASRSSKEENEKEAKKTTKTKEISYKKQMEFLNFLDYGTEKIKTDISSSRESGIIDKYSGDSLSTYFREEKI